jgi:hypothetical protein
MLISLEQAKRQLQIDFPDLDAEITSLTEEASAVVLAYLGVPETEWQDEQGQPAGVPGPVVVAVKLVLGELFKNREAAADPISPGVARLLNLVRGPVIA